MALRHTSNGIARFLDDRVAAQDDPVRFVEHDGTMLIDEVQRVPDLWLAIKHKVDRNPVPGRFLLTGSARLLALQALPDTLPGRSETIELWPLSQGEVEGTADGFVDAAFARGPELRAAQRVLRRKDYLARAERGGFPEALDRDSPRRRARFFESYLSDLLSRDVTQVAQITRAEEMRRLIVLLAAQCCGLLNYQRLSSDLAISTTTVKNYLDLLETVFVTRRVPAWSANATGRAIHTPKLTFADSGLAAYLMGKSSTNDNAGALLENLVLGELQRQLSWSDTVAHLLHYRDRDRYEVDAVLEENGGSVVGIEVKAAETVRTDDFKGLKVLQRRLGSRFRAGFVLYCGPHSLPFGEGLACLPISALWTSQAP